MSSCLDYKIDGPKPFEKFYLFLAKTISLIGFYPKYSTLYIRRDILEKIQSFVRTCLKYLSDFHGIPIRLVSVLI